RWAPWGWRAAQGRGCVHGAVNRWNLLRRAAGQWRVLDLGLARLVEEPGAVERLTDSHHAMGTADYMAPEQGLDSHAVNIRADIYSLGCTLYKLLSGRPPFCGPAYSSRFQKMLGHAQHAVPPVRDARH